MATEAAAVVVWGGGQLFLLPPPVKSSFLSAAASSESPPTVPVRSRSFFLRLTVTFGRSSTRGRLEPGGRRLKRLRREAFGL